MKIIIEHKFTAFDVNQSTYSMCIGACVIAEPIFGKIIILNEIELTLQMENKHNKENKSPNGNGYEPKKYVECWMLISRIETEPHNQRMMKKRQKS